MMALLTLSVQNSCFPPPPGISVSGSLERSNTRFGPVGWWTGFVSDTADVDALPTAVRVDDLELVAGSKNVFGYKKLGNFISKVSPRDWFRHRESVGHKACKHRSRSFVPSSSQRKRFEIRAAVIQFLNFTLKV
jgi:hypothetical protein